MNTNDQLTNNARQVLNSLRREGDSLVSQLCGEFHKQLSETQVREALVLLEKLLLVTRVGRYWRARA